MCIVNEVEVATTRVCASALCLFHLFELVLRASALLVYIAYMRRLLLRVTLKCMM